MEKDIKTVADYNMEKELVFLRGMCFDNSSSILSGRKYEKEVLTAEMVFDLAEQLFDEAVKRKYLDYGKVKDNRAINRETGKVEFGIPVTFTEKEGKEMDAGLVI